MEQKPYNLKMVEKYGIEIAIVYWYLWKQCLMFFWDYEDQLCYICKDVGLSRKDVLLALECLVKKNFITREKISPQKHKFTICDKDKYPLWKKKKHVIYSYFDTIWLSYY